MERLRRGSGFLHGSHAVCYRPETERVIKSSESSKSE